MKTPAAFVLLAFPVGLALLIEACGARTLLDTGSVVNGVTPDGGGAGSGGTRCVTVDFGNFESSCKTSSDCTPITTGTLCSDTCIDCSPNAAINVGSSAAYAAATAGLQGNALCGPCEAVTTTCFANQCVLCPGGVCPAQTGFDGGIVFSDGGTGTDGGSGFEGGGSGIDSGTFGDGGGGGSDGGLFTNDAGRTCVDISSTAFDQSCQANADCVMVATGTLCDQQCDCGGNTAINQNALGAYQMSLDGITLAACPCPAPPPPACAGGHCIPCFGGENPPPACMQ